MSFDEQAFLHQQEILEREVALLRDAIDRSNAALLEAVKTKEERDALLLQIIAKDGYIEDLKEQTKSLRGVVNEKNRILEELRNWYRCGCLSTAYCKDHNHDDFVKATEKRSVSGPKKCSFCGSERLGDVVYQGTVHCLDCCNNPKVE